MINSATGVTVAWVPKLGAAETRAAIEGAHRALVAWRGLTAKERSAILRRWGELIPTHLEDRHGL